MEVRDQVVARIRRERGLQTRIAILLGITRSAVGNWKRVPPRHVQRVSELIALHPHTIRPDIFPPASNSKKR